MKKFMKISLLGIAGILVMTACSTMSDSTNDYYGYTNKPAYEEPKSVATSYSAPSYSPDAAYTQYPSNPPVNEPTIIRETVVETNYVYFNPVLHPGYYPWWAPPQRFHVVPRYNPGVTISFGYRNHYSIWDDYWYYHGYPYYNHYYGYNYGYHYPYPVYYPIYNHRPYYYGSGWYEVPNYGSTRPKKDRSNESHRNFGTSRGGYGFSNTSSETAAPVNRRSGGETAPATRSSSGSKTIYDNNPASSNTRSGSSREVRTSDPIPAREIDTRGPSSSPTREPAPNSGRGSAIRGETPSNTRSTGTTTTPAREIDSRGPSASPSREPAPSRESSPRYEAPRREAAPAPRQEAPRREAAPAPRQESPRREAAPASSPAPSRESSRPSSNSNNNNNNSQPNRRSR